MRGVCSRAALNDRYYYEEFKTRDELLVAAWDGVRNQMLGEVSATFAERVGQPPVETIRAAISIVVLRISQDAGRAQILLTQHVGSSTLQDRRAVALQEATQLVMAASKPHLKPDADEMALRMDTFVAVGGFVEAPFAQGGRREFELGRDRRRWPPRMACGEQRPRQRRGNTVGFVGIARVDEEDAVVDAHADDEEERRQGDQIEAAAGEVQRAKAAFEEALEIFERVGDELGVADACSAFATFASHASGVNVDAEALATRARKIRERLRASEEFGFEPLEPIS